MQCDAMVKYAQQASLADFDSSLMSLNLSPDELIRVQRNLTLKKSLKTNEKVCNKSLTRLL
jgi:hypothetical protein